MSTSSSKPNLYPLPKLLDKTILLSSIVLIFIGSYTIFIIIYHAPAALSDFLTYYTTAKSLLIGESIYSSPNIQFPFVSILFVPFALLPIYPAVVIWNIFSILLYLLNAILVIKELPIRLTKYQYYLLIGIAFCWYPLLAHIGLGQVSLLVSTCLISGWALIRRNKSCLAGIFVGFACLVKLFPGIILIYFLLRKQWNSAATFITTILAGLIITVLLVGEQDMYYYLSHGVLVDSQSHIVYPINYSLTGFLRRSFTENGWVQPIAVSPLIASMLTVLASLLVLFLLIKCLFRLPQTNYGEDAAFSITLITMLLLSPISWQHILPVLVLPFGLLLSWMQRDSKPKIRILSLLTFVMVSLPDIEMARILMALFAPKPMPWHVSLLLLAPAAALIILWYLIHLYSIQNNRQP